MAQDQTQITQDTVFDILSSARRRYVLYHLRQADGPVDINELARQVAAWENDVPVEELTDQQRKRVYISLYQSHIPKLDSLGIVDHDTETGNVSLTGNAKQVDQYLDGEEQQYPWQSLYLLLSVVSASLLALVGFEVAIFSALSPAIVSVVITAAFAALAGAHYLSWRTSREQIPSELKRE
jgi:hypothetical protein